MKLKEKMKIFTSDNISLVLLTVAFILFPLSLLISKMIDGAAYVALSTLMAFAYGLYKLHPRIVGFSFGGNSIQLIEKIDEAKQLTKELKELRRVSMHQFFSSMYSTTGNNHEVMKRFYDFLSVYNVSTESPSLISEFKTEFINCLTCLKTSMEKFVRGFFDGDDSSNFDEKVKLILEKLEGETEEYFSSAPGLRMVRDFATNLVLIEEIYNSVFNDDPKPVQMPDFLGPYKVKIFSN